MPSSPACPSGKDVGIKRWLRFCVGLRFALFICAVVGLFINSLYLCTFFQQLPSPEPYRHLLCVCSHSVLDCISPCSGFPQALLLPASSRSTADAQGDSQYPRAAGLSWFVSHDGVLPSKVLGEFQLSREADELP